VAAARRAFLCDGLVKDGAPPGQIVAAIGFARPPPRRRGVVGGRVARAAGIRDRRLAAARGERRLLSRYNDFKATAPDPNYKPRTEPLPPGAVLPTTGDKLLVPWVGWLTYLPADLAAKVSIPPDIAVERLGDGGIIATLSEEPFTIDDPVHMARAKAMEAAIRPIRS
jgi:hypothetical protein